MNGTDNEGVSDAADPHHVGLESLPKGRLIIVRGTDRRGRASPLTDDEGVVLSREKSATVREDVAYARENVAGLREDAAHLHEEAAQVREGEVYTREGAAILHEQEIYMVQQANAHLVIAAIDAQILAEQIRMARDQLEYLAHHDVLTDLPNRLLLKDRLGQAIELARRQGRQLAVMYMDLDQFKYINDSLGHAVGDQLLQSVAQRLASCVRQSDTLSRQGGDEFVLMLPFIQHTQDAAFSAQKIFEAFRLPHYIDLHNLHVSMSIGISIYPDDGQDAETLLKSADTAMHGASKLP